MDHGETNQTRAARFEDEKKRIIESCFSKRDQEGMQLESYITHVRVVEDAMYPSSPPPPNSEATNKKNRVILVAVRRSGKVRVHKARENPSGTFSIGKTWNLDELVSIQNFTSIVPTNPQQHTEKQWAADVGFIVNLGKPYYWQAPTSKEKDFFIASLVKIYRKYTGGKLPELPGYTPQEIAQLTGVPPGQPTPVLKGPPSPNPQASVSIAPSIPPLNPNRPQSSHSSHPPSRETNRVEPQERDRSYMRNEHRPATRDGQRPPSQDSTRASPRSDWPGASHYAASLMARQGGEQPVPSIIPEHLQQATQRPESSQSSLKQINQQGEPLGSKPNGFSAPPLAPVNPARRRFGPVQSQESFRSAGGSEALSSSSRPSTATTDGRTPEPAASRQTGGPELLPERKGPAPEVRPNQPSIHSRTTSDAATPVATPSRLRDAKAAMTPSEDQTQPPPPPLPQRGAAQPQTDRFAGPALSEESQQQPPPPLLPQRPAQQKETEPLKDSTSSTADADHATSTVTSTAAMTEPSEVTLARKPEEEHRPGLGPMIKKRSGKDIANQFRKAALAATAFQPRQGGAGARLKAMQEKENTSNEPDGITGVVPAPLLRGTSSNSVRSATTDLPSPGGAGKDNPTTPPINDVVPPPPLPPPKVQIQRTATDDGVKLAEAEPAVQEEPSKTEERAAAASPERPRSRSPERKRRQRQEAEIEKYCSSLGIDPQVIEGRGADFNELLTEFGWDGRLPDQHKVEDFEADIRREIGRAQASGWLGHVEQQEGKVQELARAFDKAIAECEELDGLLTLYAHELDTLHEDIEYIEAQSQGLQVQTANQKLLQGELQSLLKTLTISPSDLRALQSAPIETSDGIQAVERSLALLYRAMMTIDPEIRQNKIRQAEASSTDRTGVGVYADTELGQMRAVRQKKDEYREETLMFLRRFNQHMTSMFKLVEQRSSEDNSGSLASASTASLSLKGHQASRQELWVYNAMMLFVREVNSYEWQTLITSYEMNAKSTYQEQFRDYVMVQRKTARKPTGDEPDFLFTSQEKDKGEDYSSLTSTAARKLTVKRGKTVKTSALRHQTVGDKRDGRPEAWEVFNYVLQQQAKAISEEQNFIVHFFHLNSQSNTDFAEIISSHPPEQRRLPNLNAKQSYDPDRNMARIVQQVVDGIYAFWATDMQALVEWVLKTDQLQGVGLLYALEQCLTTYEETNQEYITRTTRSLHDRLTGLFRKFVDEQVKAIEETKVKVKKRKGVISFMRTFPLFTGVVETMIPKEFAHQEAPEVRFIVNDAYTKLLKAMWESLNFIAKDNPASAGSGPAVHSTAPTSGDPEDKEALNYHVLLIENMNHYLEEVDTHRNVVLEDWAERASRDLLTHLTQYTDAVIRRPLGKWLDFLESTEALMKTTDSYASIANKPSHSRSAAKKILAAYDVKEVRKGVDTLKKRIEKHFGDADDLSTTAAASTSSKSLVSRVFDECGTRYAHAHDRMKTVIERVYDSSLEIDWRKEDVVTMFRR